MYFKDAPLNEVMENVARWYNVQIEYKSKITKTRFNGGFKRDVKLSEVLEILNAGNIPCKLVKDRNVTKIIIDTNKPSKP